jgi:hypothetical protein
MVMDQWLFTFTDIVTWLPYEEWPEVLKHDYQHTLDEWGKGPFAIMKIDEKDGFGTIPPSHPQLLTIADIRGNGQSIPQRFSGILFRTIN